MEKLITIIQYKEKGKTRAARGRQESSFQYKLKLLYMHTLIYIILYVKVGSRHNIAMQLTYGVHIDEKSPHGSYNHSRMNLCTSHNLLPIKKFRSTIIPKKVNTYHKKNSLRVISKSNKMLS